MNGGMTLHREFSADTLHDMRNLFAATAAAASLIEASPTPERSAVIATTLRDAARRGEGHCDRMLGRAAPAVSRVRYAEQTDALIADAIPLLRLAVGPRLSICTCLRGGSACTVLGEDAIEVILLELATNVRRHAVRATRVAIRTRAVGNRLWLIVANDGLPPQSIRRFGGRGLARIRRVLRAADANLHFRRSPSGGFVVGISMAIILPADEGCKS